MITNSKNTREAVLFEKHYVESDCNIVDERYPYYALKLLSTFGVKITNPERLTEDIVKVFSRIMGHNVPKSFYANPQDTKYLSCDELLIEQLVSYIKIEFITGVESENREDFDRVEVFKKAFPKYVEGDELKLRSFTIIDGEQAVDIITTEIMPAYCSYTRPWGVDEADIFLEFFNCGYYDTDCKIMCKDNLIHVFTLTNSPSLATQLDKKDVVKLSIDLFGEKSTFNARANREAFNLLYVALSNCYPCPLSKKQAKYFNTIYKKIMGKNPHETNARSPYKAAKHFIDLNKPVEAAKVFAKNGSLLQRNLVWVLSRAKSEKEFNEILDLVQAENPIVLAQLLLGLNKDTYERPRTFRFFSNNLVTAHTETAYEFENRKSKLSDEQKDMLTEFVSNKIVEAYKAAESIGKVYIDPEFDKVAIPFNTTASGKGLDVLPTGSRVKIKSDYIRTFCYWKDVYDIDASASMLKDLTVSYSNVDTLYWGSYNTKPFGDSALCSGDDRSNNGAEYQDFKLSELREKGYKYVLYTLNGYGGRFDKGEVHCGYQCKDNLKTKAWSAKNIETDIQVKGESNSYIGFAIDLENEELIVLNLTNNSGCRVVSLTDIASYSDYLDTRYLEVFNMGRVLAARGEVVETPEEADIIFTSDIKIKPAEGQKLVRPYDIDYLVSFLNIK